MARTQSRRRSSPSAGCVVAVCGRHPRGRGHDGLHHRVVDRSSRRDSRLRRPSGAARRMGSRPWPRPGGHSRGEPPISASLRRPGARRTSPSCGRPAPSPSTPGPAVCRWRAGPPPAGRTWFLETPPHFPARVSSSPIGSSPRDLLVQTSHVRPDSVHTSYLTGVAWMSHLDRFAESPAMRSPDPSPAGLSGTASGAMP